MTILTETHLIKIIREEYKKKVESFINEDSDEKETESKKPVPVSLDDLASHTKIRHKASGYLYTVVKKSDEGVEVVVYDQHRGGLVEPSALWIDRKALEKDYVID